jgi:hypothetical protein
MALPSDARRRWNLTEGGAVEIADLGELLIVVPAERGGLPRALQHAIDEAGGYAALARQVGENDPDLA